MSKENERAIPTLDSRPSDRIRSGSNRDNSSVETRLLRRQHSYGPRYATRQNPAPGYQKNIVGNYKRNTFSTWYQLYPLETPQHFHNKFDSQLIVWVVSGYQYREDVHALNRKHLKSGATFDGANFLQHSWTARWNMENGTDWNSFYDHKEFRVMITDSYVQMWLGRLRTVFIIYFILSRLPQIFCHH